MIKKFRKKAQEEMIGFALIIVIVAVILLIFLGFSLKEPEKKAIENFEVNSFIQSTLHYTSDCRDNLEFITIQKLIFDCSSKETCLDERNSCEVLNNTLKEIVENSWKTENSPVRGYSLEINRENQTIISLAKGDTTRNSKGSSQSFSQSGESFEVIFIGYY